MLVGHLPKKGNVAIEQHLDSTRNVLCNRNEPQRGLINLVVTGSSPGISDEDRERPFKPFFTAGKAGGTGLALWVSSRWSSAMGAISVDSRLVRGTRLAVWMRFEPLI